MEARVNELANQLATLGVQHQQVLQQLQAAQQEILTLRQANANAQPANVPKIKPPKPPVFTGSKQPSAVNWSYLIETYLRACDVDLTAPASITYAAGFLRDSALTWYRNHLAAVQRGIALPYNNWESFKTALVTHFTPISPERTARQKLDTLQQGAKPARTYAEQFNLCMLELPDMNEKDRVHRFLEGLRPEVRIHVELKNPTNLSDAVEWAIQADSLVWQVKRRHSSSTPRPFYPSRQQQPSPQQQQQFCNGPTPMELGAVNDKKTNNNANMQKCNRMANVRCYNCHRLGHYKSHCPQRAANLAMMSDGASPQQSN